MQRACSRAAVLWGRCAQCIRYKQKAAITFPKHPVEAFDLDAGFIAPDDNSKTHIDEDFTANGCLGSVAYPAISGGTIAITHLSSDALMNTPGGISAQRTHRLHTAPNSKLACHLPLYYSGPRHRLQHRYTLTAIGSGGPVPGTKPGHPHHFGSAGKHHAPRPWQGVQLQHYNYTGTRHTHRHRA